MHTGSFFILALSDPAFLLPMDNADCALQVPLWALPNGVSQISALGELDGEGRRAIWGLGSWHLFPAQLQAAFSSDYKIQWPWALTGLQVVWDNGGHFESVNCFFSCCSPQVLCYVEACSSLIWMKKIPQKTQEEYLLWKFLSWDCFIFLIKKNCFKNKIMINHAGKTNSNVIKFLQCEARTTQFKCKKARYLIKQRVREQHQICIFYLFPFFF